MNYNFTSENNAIEFISMNEYAVRKSKHNNYNWIMTSQFRPNKKKFISFDNILRSENIKIYSLLIFPDLKNVFSLIHLCLNIQIVNSLMIFTEKILQKIDKSLTNVAEYWIATLKNSLKTKNFQYIFNDGLPNFGSWISWQRKFPMHIETQLTFTRHNYS